MLDEQLMGVAARLATSLEALAALAAHVRIETEGLEPEPEVRALLQEIATCSWATAHRSTTHSRSSASRRRC